MDSNFVSKLVIILFYQELRKPKKAEILPTKSHDSLHFFFFELTLEMGVEYCDEFEMLRGA